MSDQPSERDLLLPCKLLIQGSVGPCLPVGGDFHVADVTEHWEPTGVEGEEPVVTTVITFVPLLTLPTMAQLLAERADHPLDPRAMLRAALATEERFPEIVCLCGSTRFYDEFQQANYDLTMAGKIVLSVGFYPHAKALHGHGEGIGHDSAEKVALDELHKRKIDLADRVLVLNVGGYIGESTRSEIEYAEAHGKPVDYLAARAIAAAIVEEP